MLPLALAAAASLALPPPQHLYLSQARAAARISGEQMAVPFTEARPRIRVRGCTRLALDTMYCEVRVTGKRAHFQYRVRVVDRPTTYKLYASRLRVD